MDSPTFLSLGLRVWNTIRSKGLTDFSSRLLRVQVPLSPGPRILLFIPRASLCPQYRLRSLVSQGPLLSSRVMATTLRHPDLIG